MNRSTDWILKLRKIKWGDENNKMKIMQNFFETLDQGVGII